MEAQRVAVRGVREAGGREAGDAVVVGVEAALGRSKGAAFAEGRAGEGETEKVADGSADESSALVRRGAGEFTFTAA